MRNSPLLGVWPRLFLLCCASFLWFTYSGCGTGRESILPGGVAEKCVIVSGEPSGFGWAAWTAKHTPEITRFSVAQLDEAIQLCQQKDAALILVDQPLGPDEDQYGTTLLSYMEAGGRLIHLGWSPSSAYLCYPLTTSVLRVKGTDTPVNLPATGAVSPRPPATGAGGERADPGRWIPVITAMSSEGYAVGWPGWIQLEPRRSGAHAVIGALSLPPLAMEPRITSVLLAAMLQEATRDTYLLSHGVDRYSAAVRENMRAGARILDRRRGTREPLRLVARWINPGGMELRRHVSSPLTDMTSWHEIDAGLAPEPPGRAPASYRLEMEIRDRNDQLTLDAASQEIKVFPETTPPVTKPVVAERGFLHQDRVPLYMLGAQYWPRVGAPSPGAQSRAHWLDPAWFRPDVVTSDLSLMAEVGINSISIEYTDPAQAPQLLFVLDELRRRNMWASVYMPSLYPLDLRMDAALHMLEAIRPAEWPEMFALEVARGITLRSRADLRRLDTAWAEWLKEQYGSATAAEQKIGDNLWSERGEIAGPPGDEIGLNPSAHRGLGLYYSFLHDYVSRQIGYARSVLRSRGHGLLLTARSAYSQPPGAGPVLDALDISAGVLHLDFLLADAWNLHPLDDMTDDVPVMSAYLHAMSGGRPLLWCSFGHPLDAASSAESMLRQEEVIAHQLKSFMKHHAAGAFVWRYNATPNGQQDWGMTGPDGQWRPVGEALRQARFDLRRWRPERARSAGSLAPWYLTASQWREAKEQRAGIFAGDASPDIFRLPGEGLDTSDLLQKNRETSWSMTDGHRMLNAEWGRIDAGVLQKPGAPGETARTYAGRLLRMELMNAGSVSWSAGDQRTPGSVWVRVLQPGYSEQWLPVRNIGRGDSQTVSWTPSVQGAWELQPYLIGYGPFGQRLRVDVTSPPGLY